MVDETPIRIKGVELGQYSIIESCKIIIVVDDTPARNGALLHRHGLSILVEAASKNSKIKILFDAGPSPGILKYNIKALNLRLEDLDAVVLSHGHYDHTDGLPAVLRFLSRHIPVIVHPRTFDPKFAYKPNLIYIGHGLNRSLIRENGGLFVQTRTPIILVNGIKTSGEIPLETDYEKPIGFWKVEGCEFREDHMIDEQALIIKPKNKGLIVIAGCSHRGIVNTIRIAQRIMDENRIYAIIGGFHLSQASDELIHSTVAALKEGASPDHIYPCHCTGIKPIKILREAFGNRCKQLITGDLVTLK
ncbi:MAG: MBL fold metallo-hydrolase [Candidatus Bathyarchaeia archaeon]